MFLSSPPYLSEASCFTIPYQGFSTGSCSYYYSSNLTSCVTLTCYSLLLEPSPSLPFEKNYRHSVGRPHPLVLPSRLSSMFLNSLLVPESCFFLFCTIIRWLLYQDLHFYLRCSTISISMRTYYSLPSVLLQNMTRTFQHGLDVVGAVRVYLALFCST